MDPSLTQDASEATKKKGFPYFLLRWIIAILLPISFFFMVPFLVGFVVVMVADLSITNPISLPSQCKIVSTSVDIRSSKICEIGLLNFKSNHVFHPFERSKYRCRYDYYWTSVFKVEYIEQFSGQTLVAYAEAPNEALPHYCRPNFGAAWLTQYKFKVNETYSCWYTSGISKVRLYQDDFFNCLADEPSAFERIREYSTLLKCPADPNRLGELSLYFPLKDGFPQDLGDGKFLVFKQGKGQVLTAVAIFITSIMCDLDVSPTDQYCSHWACLFILGILLLCGLVDYSVWEKARSYGYCRSS